MIPLAYVYKIKNKETGEFYIGSRTAKVVRTKRLAEDDLMKFYFTSGSLKDDLISNPERYYFEIVFRSNETVNDEFVAFWYEQILIMENKDNELCLNRTWFDPMTSKHCFLTAGRCFRSDENNRKHSEFLKEYHANLSDDQRKIRSIKSSISNKGKPKSDSHIEKMKVPKSEQHRMKLRKPKSEEAKQRMSDAAKKRVRKPWSEETKRKMSESAKRRWSNETDKNN